MFPPVLAGKTPSVLGDPDQPHSYTYIPDIGEGLAVLGEHPLAPGRIWHLPNDPHTRTTRELAGLVHRAAGRSRVRVRQTPPLLLRIAGVRDPAIREILEMAYLFEEPFVVDSSRITAELGVRATPAERAIAETLAGYPESRTGGTPASATRDRGRPKV
jgi:nucleoside-diphosphate-sugar epimerase